MIGYAHPVYTREGRRAQARHGEISGAQPHALLRRLLGLGLPRGRRRERAPRVAPRRPRGGAGMTRQRASTRARSATAASPCASIEFRHRSRMALVDLDELPRARVARAARLARFRRTDYLGDPRAARPRPSATSSDDGHAPTGPIRAAHPPAHARALLQPGLLLLLFDADGETARRGGRRGHQHAVGRAPRLRARRGDARACSTAASTRSMHVSPFMGMDQRYALARHRAGRDAVACTSRTSRTAAACSTRRSTCAAAASSRRALLAAAGTTLRAPSRSSTGTRSGCSSRACPSTPPERRPS